MVRPAPPVQEIARVEFIIQNPNAPQAVIFLIIAVIVVAIVSGRVGRK